MVVYYFSDDSENRTYVAIHYVLETDSGVRVRNSIYVDKSQWVADQAAKGSTKEGDVDPEQARIVRHLAERGVALTKNDFRKVSKEEYYRVTSFVSR